MQNIGQSTSATSLSQRLPSRDDVSVNAAASESQSSGEIGADFENFLELLTAQLRNQDPLSPLDSTEFVAQLASFSSVEQLVNANARLDQIAASVTGADIQQYAGLIGRDAALDGAAFEYDGSPIDFLAPNSSEGTRTVISVRDENGAVVAEFDVVKSENPQSWTPPRELEPGAYRLDAALYRGDELIEIQPAALVGRVEQITLVDGEIVLRLDNGVTGNASAVRLLREPQA
ncbi:MAG: flagellar hook capping FlgD N-terminal domain-containing protein [Pseudomonadota bacterium]